MNQSRSTFAIFVICAILCGCTTTPPSANNSDASPQAPQSTSTTETVATLQARLKAHVDRPVFAQAQWGIKVVSLDTGKTLFERNADKLMKPASNTKMYTASLALDRLGPDYRIKTSFYAHAKPDASGTIQGDLVVYGRGDPSFCARFNNDDYKKSLKPIIDSLIAAGIKHVEGDLVGDESYFRGPPFGTDWAWDDLQEYYGAPFSALTVEENVIDLKFKPGHAVGDPCQIVTMPETTFVTFSNRTHTIAKGGSANIDIYRPVGENTAYVWGNVPLGSSGDIESVAVHNPALWFVTLFKEALMRNGITVSGGLRTISWLDREVAPVDYSKWEEVATVQSRPISEIVKNTLKPSQNLYAQLLLLQVGLNKQNPADASQYAQSAGLAEMRKFLTEVGIKPGMVHIEEGSGLSRGCLLTPSASVQLLTYMTKHRCKDIFYDALPIAGVDGTLRNRFKHTAAEKNVHAKTGSLGFVNTISGYVTTKDNEHLVFSVMLNNFGDTGNISGRAESDTVVRLLSEFTGHSE